MAFDRVDIGAQIVAADAVETFDQQDIFGGQLLGLVQPAPHGRLVRSQIAGELGLATGLINTGLKGFEAGHICHDQKSYSKTYYRAIANRIEPGYPVSYRWLTWPR